MPNSPISRGILHDKNEICHHNKIATPIEHVCNDSEPVRLQDVCQVRKLGDQQHRPGSEYDSYNYLWSVQVQSDTNPYARAQAKKEQAANTLLGLQKTVCEKMRNGHQKYRCQVDMPKRPSSSMRMKWILKPRNLVNNSSQESNLDNLRVSSRKKLRKRRTSCSATPAGIKSSDLTNGITSRRRRPSMASQFQETMKKNIKNLVKVKRRKAAGRTEGGAGQPKVKAKALPKGVVVKQQLTDTSRKAKYFQGLPMKQDKLRVPKKHTLQATKFAASAREPNNVLQPIYLPTGLEPLQLVLPISPQRVPPAVAMSTCSVTDKNSSSSLASTSLSTEFGNGFSGGREKETHNRLKQSFAKQARPLTYCHQQIANQANTRDTCESSKLAIKPLEKIPTATPRKPDRSINVRVRHGGRIGKSKLYRLYRILRARGKRKRFRDKALVKKSKGSKMMSIHSSDSSLLLEPSKEIETTTISNKNDKDKMKQFLKEYEMAKSMNFVKNKSIQKPQILKQTKSEKSYANDMGSEQPDFVVSFHTPITLRTLIQRRPRPKRHATPKLIHTGH